jgi:hypothetical protein
MIVLVTLAALVTVVSTEAQQFGQGQGKGGAGSKGKGGPQTYADLKAIKIAGVVKSVQHDVIAVTVTGNQEVYVQLTPQATVTLEGMAMPDALTNGWAVEFTANVTKKGDVPAELDRLDVKDPNDPNFKQGIFNVEDPNDNPLKTLKDEENAYVIRGKIRTIKGHDIIVGVPGAPPIHGKVAPDARIMVMLGSAALAQAGDGITVEGKELKQGMVFGEKVAIKLAKPLEGKKKPGAATKTPSSAPFGASGS